LGKGISVLFPDLPVLCSTVPCQYLSGSLIRRH